MDSDCTIVGASFAGLAWTGQTDAVRPHSRASHSTSNQYNHAWLNGNNEYIMSDDHSFNPNSSLNGNWTELQPVKP